MDDLIASVVAIEGPGGVSMSTGFILAEPRVIVTDGYPLRNGGRFPQTVNVITADGKRYNDAVVHGDATHPFGVVLIEAFANVKKFPGLRLNTTRPSQGMPVHIGVAAGERVGVSSGHIHTVDLDIDIAPVGRVSKLVAIDCRVAPGASGAPVVDADLAVRGYIVAGGQERPPAIMYPSYLWAKVLKSIQTATATRVPSRKKSTARKSRRA
jgi:S1-C subfamily serine protease